MNIENNNINQNPHLAPIITQESDPEWKINIDPDESGILHPAKLLGISTLTNSSFDDVITSSLDI